MPQPHEELLEQEQHHYCDIMIHPMKEVLNPVILRLISTIVD
jgi:hypothetical protein